VDQDWIGVMIFKNFADQDWIRFNFIGSRLDSDWKISQSAHLCRPPSCTWVKIFGSVYFAAWGKCSGYFAFSQTLLVEVVMLQVWYAQEGMGQDLDLD